MYFTIVAEHVEFKPVFKRDDERDDEAAEARREEMAEPVF